MSSNEQYINRLIHEKSPYLLQHAHNPVEWYPWGEEAFQKAKKENKPIFLSIGYSTCHWCHVMEKESFEDEKMASLLNERFVSIKVDREERPDIDSIYMTICHMMNGMGGWPLNVFLTPEQVPFYSGTYFPKESRYGIPSFRDVILQLSQNYKEQPEKVKQIGTNVKEALNQAFKGTNQAHLTKDVLDNTYQTFASSFDQQYGGFGQAPKFPSPHTLMYLLRYYRYTRDPEALQMVTKTLHQLADGGIYDHLGYGFARYSVDEKYLVPHFEKMLYDQALLLIAYIETYQVTKEERFKQIANEIIQYVLREMKHAEGGFYSAEDADSEGVEGKFYVWTPDEVKGVLGEQLGTIFCDLYDVTEAGNFEGKSIPNLIHTNLHEYATRLGVSVEDLERSLSKAKDQLFKEREKRIHPFKDDKVITSWNGMMVAALAKAARVLNRSDYLQEAREGMAFIQDTLFVEERLMLRYREGEVKYLGLLDDYAYLLWAYLELYETTYDLEDIKKAKQLAYDMIELFWDSDDGGFYLYGKDHESLIARPKEAADGAVPSGNSVAALQLLRLSRLTGDHALEDYVHQLLTVFTDDLVNYSTGHAYLLQCYLLLQSSMKEVVVLLGEDQKGQALLKDLQQSFYPELTILAAFSVDELSEIAPFTNGYKRLNESSTIYVCQNFTCQTPTTDIEVVKKSINHA